MSAAVNLRLVHEGQESPSNTPLISLHKPARLLLEALERLTGAAETDQQLLAGWMAQLREMVRVIEERAGDLEAAQQQRLIAFGKLLRDRRNAAGLTRLALAGRAKLSDATIKFIETAKHPPTRATLLRLVQVPELQLTWEDVALLQEGPKPVTVPAPARVGWSQLLGLELDASAAAIEERIHALVQLESTLGRELKRLAAACDQSARDCRRRCVP